MSYGGAYQDKYAGYPAYGNGPQSFAPYQTNGMQYAVQQPGQALPHQNYDPSMSRDAYSGQYQQAQHQRPYVGSQQTQYHPQYSVYQQAQGQYLHSPSPLNPQVRVSVQYSQFQQRQAPVASQWPGQQDVDRTSIPSVAKSGQNHAQQIPADMSVRGYQQVAMPVGRHPSQHGHVQRPVSYVPRQGSGSVAASSVSSNHGREKQNVPSSPDPLAPSPNPRQARPPQPVSKSFQQQQSRPTHEAPTSKPKANVTPSSQTLQQRVASHVEIPIMPQPMKRRRSNEGSPTPVCEGPNVDYQAALLALSDEYIAAAYSMPNLDNDEHLQQYHELVATGIACVESALKNYRHPDARKEARIRLRLATLLIEETENAMDAEELLAKGIALCERSRLTDLKFAMHHLSARLMHKNSPKAALKAIDKLVQEVESLRLFHWTYAFRLLRVCLGMQMPGLTENAATLKHLTAIASAAAEHRHISMQIIAATLEAMIHLRSSTLDGVDLAQRAMASARTHQLGPEMESMPQVRALLDCLDLSCSLINFDLKHTREKMTQMHTSMDPATRQAGWSKSGSFSIHLLPCTNAELEADTLGIMKTTPDGLAALNLRWMTQSGIYVVGYLLSGITYLRKDEDRKAQSFLREASLVKAGQQILLTPNQILQGLKLNTKTAQFQPPARSLHDRSQAEDQQSLLDTTARLLLVFEYCSHFDWALARTAIDQIRQRLNVRGIMPTVHTERTLLYLEAMCKQAQGDLQGALSMYQSSDLEFSADTKTSNAEKDLRVLSALSSIMILRSLGPANVDKANELHAAVEPYCSNHPNQSFSAAYYTTKATAHDSKTAIIKTKQYLHSAVNAARSAANDQLLFIVMNAMTDLFFQSIIGEQAEKSAQAARTLAKKNGDKLWLCVADNMFGEIKERCGKNPEADAAYKEASTVLKALPEELKRGLIVGGSDGQA